MATGTIKLGKNTKNHAAGLAALGYKTVTEGDVVKVEVSGWAEKEPTNLEELKAIVSAKQGIPYLRGLMTCYAMDKILKGASCLVMTGPKAEKAVVKVDIVANLAKLL